MADYLRIKNWSRYQHYKDRNPPWIKLHFTTLSSRDWVMLNDTERVLAIACMLLASQSDMENGEFIADPDYFQRVAYLSTKPDFNPLIKSGFLEVVKADDSGCKRTLAKATTETEAEAYKEETDTSSNLRFDEWWAAWPKKVEKKKSLAIWKRRKLDRIADQIIADTKNRPTRCEKWKAGYICNPTTYLNGDRWEDEYETERKPQPKGNNKLFVPADLDGMVAFAKEHGLGEARVGENAYDYRARLWRLVKEREAA